MHNLIRASLTFLVTGLRPFAIQEQQLVTLYMESSDSTLSPDNMTNGNTSDTSSDHWVAEGGA